MEKMAKKYYDHIFDEMTEIEFDAHEEERVFKTAWEFMYAAAGELKKHVSSLIQYHRDGGKRPDIPSTAQFLKSPVEFYSTWMSTVTERFTELEHGKLLYYPIVALTYRKTLFVLKYLRQLYDHPSWQKMYDAYRKYIELTAYEGPAQMSHAEFSHAIYLCCENFIYAFESYFNALKVHLDAWKPPVIHREGIEPNRALPRMEAKLDALAATTDETLTTVKGTAAVTQETAADVKRITTENWRRKDSKYIPIEIQNVARQYWEMAKSKRYDIPQKKKNTFTKEDAYRFYKRELALAGIKSFEHFEQALRAWTNRNHRGQEKRQ